MSRSAQALVDESSFLIRQGRLDEAEAQLRAALQLEPGNAQAHAGLGGVFVYQQRYDDAIVQYRRALQLNPELFTAHYILAIALHDKGQDQDAEFHFREAIRLNPNFADVYHRLGITLMTLGRVEEAVANYRLATRLSPGFADAYNNLGNALGQQQKFAEAIECYENAARLKPNCAEIHFNWGVVLGRQEHFEEAIRHYQLALQFKPEYAEAYLNLGNTAARQGDPDRAIQYFRDALRVKPHYPEAHTNMGNVCRDYGRFEDALICFENALKQDASRAEPHHNKGLLLLLLGRWHEGWPEYEWRWQTSDFVPLKMRQPRWDGSPLTGRTLLVLAEQGLGDTLQFIRYLSLIDQRQGRVIFMCQPPLLQLLADFPDAARVIAQGASLPPFDVYIPLLSLPHLFQSTPSDVPAKVPYLRAVPDLMERWRAELQAIRESTPIAAQCQVGIAWQGSRANRNDRQRSIPLAKFSRLAEVPGVQFISLQKDPGVTGQGPENRRARSERGELERHDLGDRLDASGAFLDTAAVIKNLDLVISSDTAVPHLAGALAVPTWVALPFIPDWRWLLQRDDSPWYPTMRLFRQSRPGDWDEVFDRIAAELRKFVTSRRL